MPEAEEDGSLVIPPDLIDRIFGAQDLAELKAVLAVLQRAGAGGARAVPVDELLSPRLARDVAGAHNPEGAEARVRRAIERALTNGSLLRLTVHEPEGARQYLLPATARAADGVDRLRAEEPGAAGALGLSDGARYSVYRPNVFAFYEQHLGPLTPIVADLLRDAERSYPRIWVEDAILAAADAGTRSWRYIETILTRWEEAGGPGALPGSRREGR